MRSLTLQRLEMGDDGTFGTVTLDDGTEFKSGELPWRGNQNDLSCIPPGTYSLSWSFSPRFGRNVYHVQAVPNRGSVEVHPGNYCGDVTKGLKSDVEGCILLGQEIGILDGQKAILHSKPAVEDFENRLDGQTCELTVKEDSPDAG